MIGSTGSVYRRTCFERFMNVNEINVHSAEKRINLGVRNTMDECETACQEVSGACQMERRK